MAASLTIDSEMTESQRGYLLIASAALISHIVCVGAGFIWLDHAHIEQGLALAQNGDFRALFTHGFAGTGYYRPLMAVSLSLDAALGGSPWLYHSVTLLWHAAAGLLAALAAESLGLSRRVAHGAALLFVVHPLTSLVANAVAFRSEAIVAFSLLALVVLHVRGKAWASAAVLLTGALTKETAVVLAPLFVAALELFSPEVVAREAGKRLRLLACEGAALAVAIGLRLCFAPSWRASPLGLSANEAIGTRLAALTKSALALLLPIHEGVCDAFPVTSAFAPTALLGAALLTGACYLAYRRRGPALFLLLALLPSLQVVPVMRWWSPHYLYLVLPFAAMLLVEALERWAERALRFIAPAALALGGLSLLEARHYQSDDVFWKREVELEPACREAHYFLGDAAHAAGDLDGAARRYERALAENSTILSYVDRTAALQNLGVVRLQQERFEEARRVFRSLLDLNVDEATRRRITHNLATAELRAGRPQEAAVLLEREVSRSDALPASILLCARAVQALGRSDEARALLSRLPQRSN